MRQCTFKFGAFVLTVCFLLAAAAVQAHHSFSAEYSANKRQTVTGLVTKVEWQNPHIYFFMDVTDENDHVTQWQMEMASVPAVKRQGWNRNTLHVGDMVKVTGFRARDNSQLMTVRRVVLVDSGKTLMAPGAGPSIK